MKSFCPPGWLIARAIGKTEGDETDRLDQLIGSASPERIAQILDRINVRINDLTQIIPKKPGDRALDAALALDNLKRARETLAEKLASSTKE